MNPSIDRERIENARESDPEAARSEWDAEWRSDLAQFLDDQVIDDAVDADRPLELPPRDGINYVVFADSSGGAHDSFCIGIAHKESDRIIADVTPPTVADAHAWDRGVSQTERTARTTARKQIHAVVGGRC